MSEMNEARGGRHWMVAALMGAAVGAGVALLYAPCSGRETRGWLARRSREIKDQTTSVLEQGTSAIRSAATRIGRGSEEAAVAHDRLGHDGAASRTLRL